MRRSFALLFSTAALFTCAVGLMSQTAGSAKTPELKLSTIIEKDTYFLHEKVRVRTEFTNLSGKLLCFPPPAQECNVPAMGSVITTGRPVKASEYDHFICVIDGSGPWPREKLLATIELHWVKIPPNLTYTTGFAAAVVELNAPGEWRLESTYHPPVGPFNPKAYREYLESAAAEEGCSIPKVGVSAEPLTVTVEHSHSRPKGN